MDLNYLLTWIVCTSCAAIAFDGTRRATKYTRGWIWVSVFVLVVTLGMSYLNPAIGGLIGGCLWGVLILAPSIGLKKVNQLVAQQRYTQARKLATILCWLHPADGWLEQPELLHALELEQHGATAEAITILNRYKTAKTPIGRNATATLYQMDGNWQKLLVWIRDHLPESVLERDSRILLFYLQALGETGDLNGLLQAWELYESSLERNSDPVTRNLGRLFAFAFCGQTEQVAKLLYGAMVIYSPNVRQFWLATANLAAGNEAVAREQLLIIRDERDLRLHNAVLKRLSQSLVAPEAVLTDKSRQILLRIATELDREVRSSTRSDFKLRKANATNCLIGLNLLAFALEVILGGSTNFNTLERLGALIPEATLAGDWWRLLNATFLHYGFMHLLMNMLALYFLGPFVEFSLGISRYLLVYFTAGVGSMLVVSVMSVMGYSTADFVVGASGCIMGVVGVTAAILLRHWQRERSPIASKRLRTILLLIGLQIVFDLTTPQVSFIGHTSGLILGFLVGSLTQHD